MLQAQKDPDGIKELQEDETDIKAAAMVIERLHKLFEKEAGKLKPGQKEELSFRLLRDKEGLSEDEHKVRGRHT